MKTLSISGMIIAILGFLIALINQFYYKPIAKGLESTGGSVWGAAHHFSVILGEVALFGCGLAIVLLIVPAFKTKTKVSVIGFIIALVGLILGALQGTHMFS